MDVATFRRDILEWFSENSRDLPWRIPALSPGNRAWLDPYKILLSEMMLQQTQVLRVIPKYEAFLQELPTLESLASAPLSFVLGLWSGLGYNRRAKYLHDAAQALVDLPLPWTPDQLVMLKGIGPNTAAAICVYAFNQPHVFIETNIRSVFIYHLTSTGSDPVAKVSPTTSTTGSDPVEIGVRDSDLLPWVGQALKEQQPREFYWALMDYGAYLKRTMPNPSRSSAHHTRQSPFRGSRRQLRGQVLRYMLAVPGASSGDLALIFRDERLDEVLQALITEGLLVKKGRMLSVATSATMLH